MKKIIAALLLMSMAFTAFADDKKIEDKEIKQVNLSTESLEGRAKIGLALGYPLGIVFGYRVANYMEVNAFLGTHFSDFSMGANVLFTIADINIKDESFPLSIGPAVYFDFGKDFDMTVLGILRWEYTFKEIPLNLYIEGGPGFAFIQGFDFRWSSSLGVRYVF